MSREDMTYLYRSSSCSSDLELMVLFSCLPPFTKPSGLPALDPSIPMLATLSRDCLMLLCLDMLPLDCLIGVVPGVIPPLDCLAGVATVSMLPLDCLIGVGMGVLLLLDPPADVLWALVRPPD